MPTKPVKKDLASSHLPPIVFLRPHLGKTVQISQLTLQVSKKTFKTAVARNRARRIIKEAYRLAVAELQEKRKLPPLRISANLAILKSEFKDLKNTIKKEIQKYV